MENKKRFSSESSPIDVFLSSKDEQPKKDDQVEIKPIKPVKEQHEEPLKAEDSLEVDLEKYVLRRKPKDTRLQCTIRKKTSQNLKKQAKKENKSVNELVNEIIEDYLERNN